MIGGCFLSTALGMNRDENLIIRFSGVHPE